MHNQSSEAFVFFYFIYQKYENPDKILKNMEITAENISKLDHKIMLWVTETFTGQFLLNTFLLLKRMQMLKSSSNYFTSDKYNGKFS